MKYYSFLFGIFLIFLPLLFIFGGVNGQDSDDIHFRAKNIETLVIFTFANSPPDMQKYTDFMALFSTIPTNLPNVDYGNLPWQLHFGKYDATYLLRAADADNSTAALVVLENNKEFITNISEEVKSDPGAPPNVSITHSIISKFLNQSRDPLTKLNLIVISDICPHNETFDSFKSFGSKQIKSSSTVYSALLTDTAETCASDGNLNKTLTQIISISNAGNSTSNLKFMDPSFSMGGEAISKNLVNLFIMVTEENYNNSIDFILNHVYNTTLCGLNSLSTPELEQSYYFIMLRIKKPGETSATDKFINTATSIPIIDFKQHNINFENYLKQNLEYALMNYNNKGHEINEAITDIVGRLNNIYASPMGPTNFQYNLMFADYYPEQLDGSTIVFRNADRRSFEFLLLINDTLINDKDYKDDSQKKFFVSMTNYYTTINLYMINSTEPEEFEKLGICDLEAEPLDFKTTHVTPTLKWYYWVIIGVAVLIIIAIAANVFYWRFFRKHDPIERIANALKLTDEERKMFSNARDKLYIDGSLVVIDYNTILGRGASSTVYQAIIKGAAPLLKPKKNLENSLSDDLIVAAKVSNQFGRDQIEELIGEIEAARRLENHPNICALLGWSPHLDVPCLLFEPMELDLLNYVKSLRIYDVKEPHHHHEGGGDHENFENDEILENREGGGGDEAGDNSDTISHTSSTKSFHDHFAVPDFTEEQNKIFLQILWQATKGLEYIASKNIVHRDVAARNFLLTKEGNHFIAKIADFGLCCDVDEDTNIYRSSFNKRLPIKWLSLEALVDRTFSQASDVWAFGITMMEVYSLADELYQGIGLNEVTDYLKAGNRMEKVEKMSDEIYEIASNCWLEDPSKRPTFAQLQDGLAIFLRGNTDGYYLEVENEQRDDEDGEGGEGGRGNGDGGDESDINGSGKDDTSDRLMRM